MSSQANKKTRNRAYDLLIEIGRACEDAENDGRKENLHQFFGMVLYVITVFKCLDRTKLMKYEALSHTNLELHYI